MWVNRYIIYEKPIDILLVQVYIERMNKLSYVQTKE